MRGDERVRDGIFSYVSLEQRVPEDHPLREIRKLTDEVLRKRPVLAGCTWCCSAVIICGWLMLK